MRTNFWDLINKYKIHIPQIQRDYAQGRKHGNVPSIRKHFLEAIRNVLAVASNVETEPLELDFVYGSVAEDGKLTPLDGQQRLTTLFLLHWYAAKNENISDYKNILQKFSYESRHNTGVFCGKLVAVTENLPAEPLTGWIKNMSWYQYVYDHDPSIQSMLVTLDDIHKTFQDIPDLWKKLTEQKRIIFYFLQLSKFGLSDDLYIKMNARGKALTEFEIFKAEFEAFLRERFPARRQEICRKIDNEWTGFFWRDFWNDESPKDNVDDEMLRFIRYFSSMIFYFEQESLKRMTLSAMSETDRLPADLLTLVRKVYHSEENLDRLVLCMDALCNLPVKTAQFFNQYFTAVSEAADAVPVKVRLFFDHESNLFYKCCTKYDPFQRTNPFSIAEQLILFGSLLHIMQPTDDFLKRIRILRNLVANSEDTVRENFMSRLIRETYDLISSGELHPDETKFREAQMKEENDKINSLSGEEGPATLCAHTENHQYLRGACRILEPADSSPDSFKRNMQGFGTLFHEEKAISYKLVRQALLCAGDYSQVLHNDERYRIFAYNPNVRTWRNLLTSDRNFGPTREALRALFNALSEISTNSLQAFIDNYLKTAPKDWRYYMVCYDDIGYREDTGYGCYYWEDRENLPYEFLILNSSWCSEANIRWNFFLNCLNRLTEGKCTLDKWDSPLEVRNMDIKITADNRGFSFSGSERAEGILRNLCEQNILSPDRRLNIPQDTNGLDTEDRLLSAVKVIGKMQS
jgi:hypothetical protein